MLIFVPISKVEYIVIKINSTNINIRVNGFKIKLNILSLVIY